MFGALFFERDPLRLQDLPTGLISWTQDVGGLAAFGLFIWVLVWLFGLHRKSEDLPGWLVTLFRLGLVATLLAYSPLVPVLLYDAWSALSVTLGMAPPGPTMDARFEVLRKYQMLSLTAGGAIALLTASLPFLSNLIELRWRRVWALAKLSFKEAIRRRILYAFSGFLLIFLFGSWFISSKPEDQVRTYVSVVFGGMTFLLILAAAILASFSIPTDIKQQTIHTIVTKPVERFEVILGRFLGFSALMTLVLAFMAAISLLYIFRGVDPDAAADSLKAREPLYGDLSYENSTSKEHATSVGREWDYRSYITAPVLDSTPPETAVWTFSSVPASIAEQKAIRCEYSFDIFRTTKGTENKGISCNFIFTTPNAKGTPAQFARLLEERRRQPGAKPDAEIESELAEELGVYPRLSQEVTDYHTLWITIPGGLFRAANKAVREGAKDPPLEVRVTCNDKTQYVGMAKYDLYLRLDDPAGTNDQMRFAQNFFKAAAGLWMRLVLVIGLAVSLSTYLSGVISLIITLMIYVGGLFQEFIETVAKGTNIGGGPVESMLRLARAENAVTPLEATTANKFAEFSDVGFRWLIRRVLDVIPDVDRFDFTSHVAEGFNIPADQLLMSLLLLIAYILPWAILAYFLIKWREIASSS